VCTLVKTRVGDEAAPPSGSQKTSPDPLLRSGVPAQHRDVLRSRGTSVPVSRAPSALCYDVGGFLTIGPQAVTSTTNLRPPPARSRARADGGVCSHRRSPAVSESWFRLEGSEAGKVRSGKSIPFAMAASRGPAATPLAAALLLVHVLCIAPDGSAPRSTHVGGGTYLFFI